MKNRNSSQKNQTPILRFSPTAWAKLRFCRDVTDNEVGGFGITQADDLLFIKDFALVKQKVTSVSVAFDDESVANLFEDQVEAGRKPEQFARIWLHTHPGDCPEPSMTDETTFVRVFGTCDWSVMCIVAQDDSIFARMRFNAGPGGEVKIPVSIDYSVEFEAADFNEWKKQYTLNVFEEKFLPVKAKPVKAISKDIFGCDGSENIPAFDYYKVLDELEAMEPMEREVFMEELAIRSEFWDEESEVLYG